MPRQGWLTTPKTEPDTGLLVSLPIDTDDCYVDAIDLTAGRKGIKVAKAVLAWRKQKPVRPF